MSSSRTLKTVVFLGSARDIAGPWGGDKRTGDRVLAWVKDTLSSRTATYGSETVSHDVTILDPLEAFSPDGALASCGAELRAVHFYQKDPPPAMNEMREVIKDADCYVIVSPEYNHSVPPALAGLMGAFGGSNYLYKPAATVMYSPSPWGGMRGAVALRPFLAELGCLPISKLCGIPHVNEILNADGKPVDEGHRMLKQLPNMLTQLEYVALAMVKQRETSGLPK